MIISNCKKNCGVHGLYKNISGFQGLNKAVDVIITLSHDLFLYIQAPKVSQLRQLLHEKTNRNVFTLEDVDALLYRLTGWKRHWLDDQSTPDGDVELDEAVTDTRESRFNTPCLELFLWAVLMNR